MIGGPGRPPPAAPAGTAAPCAGRARHGWRIAAALVATLLAAVVGGGTGVATPAGAALALGTDEPLPLEPSVLALVDQTTFVAPVDVLQLGLDLSGAPPGSTLSLGLHPAVGSRTAFLDTLAGEGLRGVLRTYQDLPVDALPRDAQGLVRLDLAITDEGAQPTAGFRIDAEGVYPLSIELDDADGNEVDRLVTHVVRLPATDDPDPGVPLATAVVVQLEAPSSTRPDGTVVLDDASAAGARRAMAAVVANPTVPLTLEAVPEALAALAGDPTAEVTVEDLRGALAGRQVLAETYVPLATSGWVAAGRRDVVAGEVQVGAATLADVLGLPAVPATTWRVDPSIDPASLDVLRDRGTTSLIVPEPLLSPIDPRDAPLTLTESFDVPTADGTLLRSMMADEGLRLRLTSTDQPALAANRTLAELSVLALDAPDDPRGAVLLVPGDADTPRALAPVLAQLAEGAAPAAGGTPLLVPTTVDELFAIVGAASAPDADDDQVLVRPLNAPPPEAIDGLAPVLDDAQRAVDSYRSMLPTGDDEFARSAQRLIFAAPDRRLDTGTQLDLLDGARTIVADRTAGVSAPAQGTVTVTASEASIPLLLDNALAEPVEVEVQLRAEKLEFPEGDRVRATLSPGTNRLEVRVRTRASGAFPVEVAVTSPDGGIDLAETRVQVRSTAVSGLGLVLSVGAGVFLAAWWARNLRTSRRRKRLVSAEGHPTGRPGPDPSPPPG